MATPDSTPRDGHSRLILRWDQLPQREVPNPSKGLGQIFAGQPWIDTGRRGEPFDFSARMGRLIADIVARCPDLAHIQTPRLLLTFTPARHRSKHGLQARVTPLRFAKGQIQRTRRGVTYQVQRFFHRDHEFLYLMTFCLPRFLNQDFDDKLVTLFHELFHIHPDFNGDLRRHEGRYHLHTHSQKSYDAEMAEHARAYLHGKPDPALHSFLRLNFAQLRERHRKVVGINVPRPKLIPVPTPQSAAASRSKDE